MLPDDAALDSLIADAAAVALDFAARRETLSVADKGAGQFVSAADQDVEALIRTRLAILHPGAAIIGEEEGGALDAQASGWVIDPIDGTTNFLCGMPVWAVSIGYLEHGQPLLAAVALPDLGVTLTARKGQGLRRNGAPFRPSAPAGAARLFALGENDFDPITAVDARAAELRAQGRGVVRYYCAVFSLANVALGRLDGYVEHGCRLWDIAAGWLLCTEAGAEVATGEIAPGRYKIEARWPVSG